MNLTQKEKEVVSAVIEPDIVNKSGKSIQSLRCFRDLDTENLTNLIEQYGDYIKNDDVPRLPGTSEILAFMNDYPFFRVFGYFHNLGVDSQLGIYITGLECSQGMDLPLNGFDEATLNEMKKQFVGLFYKADTLSIEGTEVVCDYKFDRLLEANA